ncbi:CGNR zinc finger domain-containing protein [Ornithinimicrobium pratense]|uniref:CGNR zinc finger domain-containing protein n=1 Tax=Ornithinimicrobium pratense TaxID=2593973 RepID=A0A5J6V7Q1_9MICO|nr:CGNR zinc finger domain-containing protein [Ornithinimicrobium pratense]QFG69835.1 CGNR zinc finger domain-containing protein [Ornithinimicrobium pratense]
MHFTHDTQLALQAAAALVNTSLRREGDVDELATVSELEAFVRRWRWTGRRTRDRAELDEVRHLRPRLEAFWEEGEEGVAQLANTLLAEAQALPRLVNHDDLGWHLHATPDDAPLATRMAVEAAMAFGDVLRADELRRLRVCEADDCRDVHVDLSRNRSRRYCSTTCGNRMAAAAYRERQGARPTENPRPSNETEDGS